MEDMGNNPARESATCAHPTIGTTDVTQTATPTDIYAARHDPFVYFHSIIDTQAYCDAHVVPLASADAFLRTIVPEVTSSPAYQQEVSVAG
jgi:hypothetical protein